MVRASYRNMYFGASDSRNEDAAEFVRSYVELKGASSSVVSGDKFLVLGPKGTGKSAIARFIELTEGRGDHVCLTRDASSLPLADIPRIQTGQPAGPERTVAAWKFILLSNYLGVLLRDQGCSLHFEPEVARVAALLENFGFMGSVSGRALIDLATTTWTIPIPKTGAVYQRQKTRTVNMYNLIPFLEDWACSARSSQRHVLMLDGLDSIFLNDPQYDQSLASLVQAAYSLDQLLRNRSATGSIVLLLRYDAFARVALTLPDSQKMRDDLSIEDIFPGRTDGRISQEVVREGVLKYCTKYFVGAISNEFAGSEAVGDVRVEDAIAALHHMHREQFDRVLFKKTLTEETGSKPDDVDRLLRLLFYSGAIGNIVAGRGQSYMQFYHRRDDVPIYLKGSFALHNALLHAWSIPRGA